AEDGIRDFHVTGVQTCALPISIVGIGNVIIGPVTIGHHVMLAQHIVVSGLNHGYQDVMVPPSKQEVICKKITIDDSVWIGANSRSEERRVGKEWRSRW